MKLKVNNKPATPEEKQQHSNKKLLKKQFGDLDIQTVFKYIQKLEKRIEVLEKR